MSFVPAAVPKHGLPSLSTPANPSFADAHNYHVAGPLLRSGGTGCCNWAYHFSEERHSVAFGGSHVGTHASHDAYGLGAADRGVPWWNLSSNVGPLSVSTPWWEAAVPLTPFNQLINDVRLVRNAKAGTPLTVGYHPYLKPKQAQRPTKPPEPNYHAGGQDGIYGDSDLYQEHLIHIMLSAATRHVATWNFEFSASANLLLSACLSELDEVFDVDTSTESVSIEKGPFGSEIRFGASFVVSGAVALNHAADGTVRTVYRVTFRNPAVLPVDPVAGSPASFSVSTAAEIKEGKLGFVGTPIVGATLLLPRNGSACSTRGFWLETRTPSAVA